jgi:hypothetical protein
LCLHFLLEKLRDMCLTEHINDKSISIVLPK